MFSFHYLANNLIMGILRVFSNTEEGVCHIFLQLITNKLFLYFLFIFGLDKKNLFGKREEKYNIIK